MSKVTAQDIKAELIMKHESDIAMPEPLLGGSGARRLDFVAIKPSWTNQSITGYEIKVSRADFMQDTKYQDYTEYCNKMFLVCPKDMISKDEVAPGIGLMYFNPNAKKVKLRTVKAAALSKAPLKADLLMHILMWRYKINSEYAYDLQMLEKEERKKQIMNFIEDKWARGKVVKSAMLELLEEKKDEVQRLHNELGHYNRIKDDLEKLKELLGSYSYLEKAIKIVEAANDGNQKPIEIAHEIRVIERQLEKIKQVAM